MNATPPTPADRRSPRSHTLRNVGLGAGIVVALLVGAVLVCEWAGWPFLRRPMENFLSQKLDRVVSFDGSGNTRWQLRLLGGVRLKTDSLQIAGPSWSTLGPMLVAQNAALELRYGDLLAVRRGEPLLVKALKADDLTLRMEREPGGRASWQFGPPKTEQEKAEGSKFEGVRFDLLEVRQGTAMVDDKVQQFSVLARFALRESWTTGADAPRLPPGSVDVRTPGPGASAPTRVAANDAKAASAPARAASGSSEDLKGYGVVAEAEGHFRGTPLKASLRTGSALPWLSSDKNAPAVPVTLRGGLGNARLSFDGQVRDLLVSQGLIGSYELSGPSLAAVGEPLGITLPTTPPFAMKGTLSRNGPRWSTDVKSATIGKSKLNGEFEFYKAPYEKNKLTGTLRGSELWLADLGPSIGVGTASGSTADRAAARADVKAEGKSAARAGRVLPDKRFDLPSLRVMDADVTVKLDRFESGTALLQAAEPLNGRIVLKDGVLEVRDIDARVARGQFAGLVRLDGREPSAKWTVRLRVAGVHLEQWLNLERKKGQSPWVTGVMGGRINLDGRGRSTADLLATADGRMVLYWTQGSVSHLIVEAAGIDVAQSLGTLISGDKPLAVACGVADLKVKQGRVTPQPMVIDTTDSLVLVDGDMSLATERLMLRAKVEPKDMSPLTLRTPLKLQGSFSDPDVSLEKGPLLKRVVPAVVLGAAVTPLAALIPLVDLGEDPDAESKAALSECNASFGRAARRGASS